MAANASDAVACSLITVNSPGRTPRGCTTLNVARPAFIWVSVWVDSGVSLHAARAEVSFTRVNGRDAPV